MFRTCLRVRSVRRLLATTEQFPGYIPPKVDALPERWPTMSDIDRQEVIEYLKWKMEDPSWKEMTSDEKKASYYVSFGEWGPRAKVPEVSISETLLRGVFTGLAFTAFAVSVINYMADKETEKELEESTEVSK